MSTRPTLAERTQMAHDAERALTLLCRNESELRACVVAVMQTATDLAAAGDEHIEHNLRRIEDGWALLVQGLQAFEEIAD